MRRFIRKAKYAQWLAIIRSLKAAVSARDEDELEKVMSLCAELPYGGASMPIIKEAKKVLAEVREETVYSSSSKTLLKAKTYPRYIALFRLPLLLPLHPLRWHLF